MHKRLAVFVLLGSLAACGNPGSAVDGPPPEAVAVDGAPAANGPAMGGQGATLKAVKARGRLVCGVNQGLIGFAYPDNRGRWRGFDVDFCRAMAAAIFGDPNAVRFQPLSSKERFTAVVSGEVDVLWRNTTWTLSRDTGNALDFAGVNYYDGQGFMVPKSLNVHSVAELSGARICVQTGTTTELTLADYFRARGLKYEPVVVETEDQARSNYAKEACDALTTDVSQLAAARSTLSNPNDHIILPEVVSKEPLGPAVRQGDSQWRDIVSWTLYATILAEELGVTQANVDEMRRNSKDPETRRLLGVEGGMGAMMGLSDDWAYRVIKAEGNYSEIFERNIGRTSPMKLERGINALWSTDKPGLMYAPPVR
jgi:general L-amino acid transport system substrate-binding protein